MENQKVFRRIVGYLAARFRQLGLGKVDDPRRRQGQRWKLEQVIAAVLLGMMAGCKNLREVERLTSKLSRPIRRRLGIPRRLPDTTARDLLCQLSPQSLIPVLHRVLAIGSRVGSLEKERLPFHMVAMDGKWTALPSWSGPYAQKQTPEGGAPYGMMRTVTSVLASTPSRPCIDVSPIPDATNEMGHFQAAFDAMWSRYHQLFEMVSYDQGANSENNALHVLGRKKHYLFRLNDERRRMQQLAMELLNHKEVVAETHDVTSNEQEVFRRLRIIRVNTGRLSELPRKSELWKHTKTLLCVESETRTNGMMTAFERRYYASSMPADRMTKEQWLACVRFHWRVELSHQTFDSAFEEDDHPWIVNDPNGMLVVLILRRIAYTMLTLYRSVRQRSEEKRQGPWAELFENVADALKASTEATVNSLRRRALAPHPVLAAVA
jgi:hypothetical protein